MTVTSKHLKAFTGSKITIVRKDGKEISGRKDKEKTPGSMSVITKDGKKVRVHNGDISQVVSEMRMGGSLGGEAKPNESSVVQPEKRKRGRPKKVREAVQDAPEPPKFLSMPEDITFGQAMSFICSLDSVHDTVAGFDRHDPNCFFVYSSQSLGLLFRHFNLAAKQKYFESGVMEAKLTPTLSIKFTMAAVRWHVESGRIEERKNETKGGLNELFVSEDLGKWPETLGGLSADDVSYRLGRAMGKFDEVVMAEEPKAAGETIEAPLAATEEGRSNVDQETAVGLAEAMEAIVAIRKACGDRKEPDLDLAVARLKELAKRAVDAL
jgi:hypothetical protein